MMSTEHNETDERMKIMFNAMPLSANIHNRSFDFFDCNESAINLFGFSNKQEYIDNFHKLSPEYQPDGSLSSVKAAEFVAKAFDEGYCRFEWIHQKLNGEPIPCEVTLVRVKYKNEFVLAAYMRDLRELKQVMEEVKQRESLLNTVNSVANVLLSVNDEKSFEASLLKSFELVGHCLDVDRVQIWRNEVIDNELHFVHRYEWLSDCGRNNVPIPIGLHFPYSQKPEWESLFFRGKYINSPLSGLSESDRAFLEPYGMKSIMIIPMFLEGNFWGFFCINDCHREHTFSDDEIQILTSVGLMMINAVNRNLQIAKMREAEQRTVVMLDTTPLCVNFWNRELNNIDCNQEAVKLFNLSSKQEYLDKFYQLSPEYQPDGRLSSEKAVELVGKAFEKGYDRFEWMHQKLNGEPVPCEITLVRVEYKEDFIVLGYARDLREYKAMLGEIHRENEKSQAMAYWYNSILNAIPLPISVTDADTKWTFINTAVEKLLGITLKDAIGKPCSNWAAYICNTPDCGIECAKRGLKQTYFSDGDKSYQADVTMLKDLSCETIGYIEVVQDITNLKTMAKKQAETEAANHILKNILNGIDAEIYVSVPHTGELLFVNDYMKKQNNIEDDCTGRLCYKVFVDANQEGICDFCPCYKLDKDPHSTVVWEFRLPTNRISRNATRYIQWTDGRTAQIQYSVDVTEIITAKEQAIQANKDKSSFLAKISHEIRSPMNAVLGITEIQLQNESLPSDTQEALEKIYNSGYLLLGIINDILDMSKIEAGKLELSQVSYDTASLINDTVQLNTMLFDNKPIKFELQINENIPSILTGDELRIKQILNNLLSNAFKYTDKGKVLLSADFETLQAETDGIILIFRVSDTGQGMTTEQVSKLFDEYTRFNTEANRMTTGTGLGMSITKHLIKLMNGEIFVESKPDYGSSFTVRLPQKIIPGSGILGKDLVENIGQLHSGKMSKMKKTPVIQEYMPYGKVLVVDDVETNLYVARGLMTPYALSLETAASGFEAIDKVKSGTTWDIIFMDHFMPEMDGIEAAKIIRSLGYTQPIVALTANVLAGQAEMFHANGFDGFISKPIDIRQLNDTLNKLVRDKYPAETVKAARQLRENLRKKFDRNSSNVLANQDMAKIFTRDAEKASGILEAIHTNNYRRDNDIQIYTINCHAMKSALANIGETELSSAARKLEDAGRNRNIDIMISETPAFIKSLRNVIEKIKPKEDNLNVEDLNDDHIFLLEKLTVLKKACAEFDKKAAKTALMELQQKTWSRPVGKLLDTITEHLLHSEFAEAANLAQDYKNEKNYNKP